MWESIISLVSPFAQEAVRVGIDALKTRSDVANLRVVLRRRLEREVRLNLEIFKELGVGQPKAVLALNTIVLEQLFSQVLPLDFLFERPLSEKVKEIIIGKKNSKRTYARYISTIQTEGELIERMWIRLAVAKVRAENGKSLGDVEYLRRMMAGLSASLKTK